MLLVCRLKALHSRSREGDLGMDNSRGWYTAAQRSPEPERNAALGSDACPEGTVR